MDNIKIYIKTHPRRTIIFALLIAFTLIVFYVVAMFALQKPVETIILNPVVSISVSEPVSAAMTNPETSIIPPEAEPTSCLDTDLKFSNTYFSMCYPGYYLLSAGDEELGSDTTEGRPELGLWSADENGGPVFALDRTDSDNSLRFHISVAEGTNYSETPKELHTLAEVANYMYELDKKTANEISVMNTTTFGNNTAYTYTYKSNVVNTFRGGGVNSLPDNERKVLILRVGNQDYDIVFVNNADGVNQRIVNTLVFN